jgi:hypothetical protein
MTQSRPYLAHQNFPWGDEKQILSSKSVATSDIMPKPNQTAPNHGRGLSGESRRWDKADRMSTPLSKARGNKTQIDRTRGSGSGTIKRFKSRDQEEYGPNALCQNNTNEFTVFRTMLLQPRGHSRGFRQMIPLP